MARFDCAIWRPVANHGGGMAAQLGLILHHAVADGSLFDQFNNPSTEVSAHFWVGRDGTVEQYVDSESQAWHAMQLNDGYCGVETEGCVAPPHAEPMTEPMVDGLARIYAEGHRRHGWPLVTVDIDGQSGFGYHRMAVATACPCDVRLNMRAEILTRAGEIVDGDGGASAPPTTPPGAGVGAPPWPGRYLCYPPAMQGTDVHTWQSQMRARGWALGVDGIYGPESAEICRQFQAEKQLGVDGIVGPETWAATWTAPVT